jgi:hypothetical protein
MIRFIVKRTLKDFDDLGPTESFYTIDVDVPELEAALKRGGCDPVKGLYDYHEFVGIEIQEADNESD